MIKIIKDSKKPIKLKEELLIIKDKTSVTEDFFNLLICLTSITRELTDKPKFNKKDAEIIEQQKQLITQGITIIADMLNLDKEEYNKEENKKKLKEAKPAEYVEYDVIPLLRFQEIQANLNTIIEGYIEVGDNISYEQTRNIATDLTRIENAIDNIGTTLSNELANNLIYKEG